MRAFDSLSSFAVGAALAGGLVVFALSGCRSPAGDAASGGGEAPRGLRAQATGVEPRVTGARASYRDRTLLDVACPVTGDAAAQECAIEHTSRTIYFCSDDCVKRFRKEPGRYGG